MTTTGPTVFEEANVSRDERMYDAANMLERLALFLREDGCTQLDWLARCDEAWEIAGDAL